jgi:hypothetical protein
MMKPISTADSRLYNIDKYALQTVEEFAYVTKAEHKVVAINPSPKQTPMV